MGNMYDETEVLLSQRYRILSPLKVGGMAGVYLAKDTRLNAMCAVKELDIKSFSDGGKEYSIQNFKSEAELLANLRHSSLPRVIDYFYEDGKYYLVMDYISGDDLGSIMEKEGIPWLEEKKVLSWALELCDVLIYLHSQLPPVIYRDLKPSNIMLRDKDQKVMLIDFGLAQMAQVKPLSSEMAFGTIGYSPPEQYAGREEPRSDIYSLGVTLHHLLTGTPPGINFNFKPVREINSGVSPELEAIVMKALKKSIGLRYATATAMKEDLLLVMENLDLSDEESGESRDVKIKEKFIRPIAALKGDGKDNSGKKISVFLVEDDGAVRKMLRTYIGFNEDMFIMGEAVNGKEAIEKFKNFRILPDVILMDISMPEVDGISATQEIIKISPTSKIIILTALQSRKEIVIDAFKAGATGYMLKDSALDNIAGAIRNTYYGGSPIEPAVATILINEVKAQPEKQLVYYKKEEYEDILRENTPLKTITFLHEKKASGKLVIESEEATASIYIKEGELVHAVCSGWTGIEALEYITGISDSVLTFSSFEESPLVTFEGATEDILADVTLKEEEWENIKKIVKTPQDKFKFDLSSKIHSVNFEPSQRFMLPYLNGEYSVLDISLETGKKYYDIVKEIYNIYSMGVLKKCGD